MTDKRNDLIVQEYQGPTLEQLKNAAHGFHVVSFNPSTNTHSKCARWRISGRIQTWVRASNAHRVRIPVKFGLYANDAVTQSDVGNRSVYAFQGLDTDLCPFCDAHYF